MSLITKSLYPMKSCNGRLCLKLRTPCPHHSASPSLEGPSSNQVVHFKIRHHRFLIPSSSSCKAFLVFELGVLRFDMLLERGAVGCQLKPLLAVGADHGFRCGIAFQLA